MSYANYEFSPGATLSVVPKGARGQVVEARWALGLEERLSMDLTPAMAARLRRLPAAFGVAQFERAIGDRLSASLILRHLLRRGLVIEQPAWPGRGASTPGRPGTALGRPTSRLVTAWPLSVTAYQIVTEPLAVPDTVVPLAYVGAAINGDWTGFGVSPDPGIAQRTGRCEALERFGVLHPELAQPERWAGTMASLAKTRGLMFDFFRMAAPASVEGEARERFRLARTVVGDGRRAVGLMPVEWIYLGQSPVANTNGTAFGVTPREAITSAKRELVERDLLLRAWYGLVRSREITSALKQYPAIEQWRHAALARGLRARWFALGDDRRALATVVCTLGADAPPHFGSGSATRPDLVSAAEKAFLEAAGSHLGQVMAAATVGRRKFVRTALGHLAGRAAAFKRTAFESFWAARGADGLDEIAARFSRSRIQRPSLDPRGCLWIDATPAGFTEGHVVKVFHPDAVPLPNTMEQVVVLETLLGVRGNGTPPPIS